MSARAAKTLSDEDRILWSNVARTAVPLKGRNTMLADFGDAEPDEPPRPAVETHPAPPPRPASAQPAPHKARKPDIDRPTRDKLKKGRVAIDGKIDLHDMTQGSAHALLLAFLRRGHAEGRRHVLVVTGKGSSLGSDGVLRRAVPQWLATPDFRPLVSGWSEAARNHGGAGALYIRIARNPMDGR